MSGEALDESGLSIDYRESEFYYLYDDMDKLLIVSHPVTWSGLMASFSFYQIMDMRKGDAPTPAKIRVAEVEAGERLELAVERPALQMAENFLNGRPYNRGDDPRYGNRILYTTDKDYYWAQCRFGERVPEFVTDTLFRTGRAAYDRITAAINGLTKWSASGLVGIWFDENPQVEATIKDGREIPEMKIRKITQE